MSWTATVLLICEFGENYPNGDNGLEEDYVEVPPPIAAINEWLVENEQDPLKDLDDAITEGKGPGAHLYGTVLNFGELDKLVPFIKGLKWIWPENVQILTKDQEERRFTIHTIS